MTADASGHPLILHAGCVMFNECGVLIIGPSGVGKSSLALHLMALGAELVSDDRTCLRLSGQHVIASAPEALSGLIEARHVGLLKAQHRAEAPITLVVDLEHIETERLPLRRKTMLLGQERDLVLGSALHHLAPALICWLKAGRQA